MKALPLLAVCGLLGALPLRAVAADEAKAPSEPKIERQVIEDDNVRIEELRVRGQTQSIVVQSKIRGVAPYRILPGTGALDPSQPNQTSGQRVWQFSF